MDIADVLEDQNRWWSNSAYRAARLFPHRRAQFAQINVHAADSSGARAALLIGPRQVGKTTLLLQLADHLLDQGWPPGNLTFFDFADDRLTAPISPRVVTDAQPAMVRQDCPRIFLLDEIQEAIAWQRWLKTAVDHARRESSASRSIFIATGSAVGALRDGGVESGQGRWDEITIEGLTYREFLLVNGPLLDDDDQAIDQALGRNPALFERYLLTGGFPEHAMSASVVSALPRIRQDIIERAVLRDLRRTGVELDRVRRLLVHLINGSGMTWNGVARARDLEANRKSVEEWVALLEAIHLVYPLEPDVVRRARASGQLRARPRLYAADHALITALSPYADPLADPETRGRVLEAAVFRHLREVARQGSGRLGYFRHADDLEIDFVWRPEHGPAVGVEVTASRDARDRKIARLRDAGRAGDVGRRLLVYDGLTRDRRDDVRIVPAHEFLRAPISHLQEDS